MVVEGVRKREGITESEEPQENDPLYSEFKSQDNGKTNTRLIDKIRAVTSEITVEPMSAFFIIPIMLSNLAMQNLNLEKACRVNLNYSDVVCGALERRETENYTSYEVEVQRLTASVAAWKSVIQTVIPCFVILFVGAWSDKTGRRKICMILPVCGELLTCISNMLNTYFFYQLPLEVLVFMEVIFPAMTGGWGTMFLGVFSYIGDVTSPENRTFRLGIVNLCMSIGFPIGMALSGILLKKIGFYGIFSLSASIHLMSLMYGIFVLKDPKRPTTHEVAKGSVRFFDLEHVRDTLGIIFRKSSGQKRFRICMLFGIVCMLFGPMYGEITILYLSTRFRFNWNAVEFSFYITYSFITHLVGTMFCIGVLSRILHWHDSMLGIISTISKVAGSLLNAFAVTGRQFYIGPLVEILNGTSMLALRSIMSKIVSSDEQGKINSVMGLAETMMPVVYAPLYTRIYMATFEVFPGAVFLLSAGLTFVPAFAFLYLFIEHRREQRKTDSSEQPPTQAPPPPLYSPT